MRKWKSVLYITGVLFITAAVQLIVNRCFKNDTRIIDAFVNCDTNIYESSLDVVVNYGKEVMTVKQKRQVLNTMAGNIGISKGYSISDKTNDGADTFELQKKSGDTSTKMEFVSVAPVGTEDGKFSNHFLLVNITVNDKFENILIYKNRIEKDLKEKGLTDYQISLTLRGGLDGELTKKQKNTKVKSFLNQLGAREVNRIESDDLYTVYAYTGFVDDSIKVSGYRININIAISYDETKDETEIYLATPILNVSY